MAFNIQGAFDNYYELLGVAENASSLEIQVALADYRAKLEEKMTNPFSMSKARSAMNEIVPAIERFLLSGDEARAAYDQQLAASRRSQTADYEPADDEGLDDPLRIPFLFKPLEDFDTEIPGYTLRLTAMKLDAEWSSARTWITDTSDETHGFISYLTFVANRKRLAEHVGDIIKAVSPDRKQRMDINEGIERCINILDPHTERPRVGIHNSTFDGKIFDAGSFISDLPARTELIVEHEGVRGCAFGTIESHTDWLTFVQGSRSGHFALMPLGTEAAIGPSAIKIPIFFNVSKLQRNANHSALLVLRMENQINVIEQSIQVVVYVQPLPPRVVFEPTSPQPMLQRGAPFWAGIARRGVPARVVVMPRNHGDEGLRPLAARVATNDKAANAQPAQFGVNQPITLTIDTSTRPFGEKYSVDFNINYITPGADGPTTIQVQGETLPTIRQSMQREKPMEERAGAGCVLGFVSLAVFGGLSAALAAHISLDWLFFPLVPLLFVLAVRPIVSTTVIHAQRAGNTQTRIENIAPLVLWGIPIALGLLIALVCILLPDIGTSVVIGAATGFMLGSVLGFVLDKTRSASTNTPVPPTN